MSNAKIQMSNQAQNPNVKTLSAYLCPCARIPERGVGIWVLEFDIHLGHLQKSGKREDATEDSFASGSLELWNLSL
jgi:hypothetical protein